MVVLGFWAGSPGARRPIASRQGVESGAQNLCRVAQKTMHRLPLSGTIGACVINISRDDDCPSPGPAGAEARHAGPGLPCTTCGLTL